MATTPMLRILTAVPALLASSLWCSGVSAQSGDAKLIRYGEHLSQECTSCHRRDGADNGIPAIVGLKASEFTELMGYYKSGARPNEAMVSVAKSLDDGQIKALAEYFATLPKPPKKSATAP